MINLNPEARMYILLNSSNKALADVIKNATPQQLATLNQNKDIKSLLQNILNDTLSSTKSHQVLLDMLKNSPNFKQLGEFNSNLKTLLATLKEQKLPQNLAQNVAVLEKFLSSIKNIDPKILQQQIKSSGIFMESKLATIVDKLPALLKDLETLKQILQQNPAKEYKALATNIEQLLKSSDVKGANLSEQKAELLSQNIKNISQELQKLPLQKELHTLNAKLQAHFEPKSLLLKTLINEELRDDVKLNILKLKEELGTTNNPLSVKVNELSEKLLMQIDYHQMLSHLSSSSSLYLPFSWELLEEGSLYFKKQDEEKFYCHIELKLKEYGELELMLSLYKNKELELSAITQQESLRELLHENLAQLRTRLIESEIYPKSIRVSAKNAQSKNLDTNYSSHFESSSSFEVKV